MEQETKTNNNKKVRTIIIIIAVILMILGIVIININSKQTSNNKTSKKEIKKNYKLMYDMNTAMEITPLSSGGISSEIEAIILMTAKEVGEVQIASFKVKNNTKEEMIISPSDFKITFRYSSDPDTEEYYHIIEEEKLNEYYNVELTKPAGEVKLEAGQTTDVEVKATLKKSFENKYVVGSYHINIIEK